MHRSHAGVGLTVGWLFVCVCVCASVCLQVCYLKLPSRMVCERQGNPAPCGSVVTVLYRSRITKQYTFTHPNI